MIYVAVVAGIVIWVVLLGWLVIECYGWTPRIIAFVLFVVPIGLLFQAMSDYEQRFPCVQYETRLQYSPATKTMLPMRICVERGEWVK